MQELIHGAGIFCIYFVVAASTMLARRWLFKIPDELFRKTLHFVLLASCIPFVFAFESWWISALFAVVFEILVYPILAGLCWLPHRSHLSPLLRPADHLGSRPRQGIKAEN